MNKIKFLKALQILHEENKKNNYGSGYSKALYDVMQVMDLCEDKEITKE